MACLTDITKSYCLTDYLMLRIHSHMSVVCGVIATVPREIKPAQVSSFGNLKKFQGHMACLTVIGKYLSDHMVRIHMHVSSLWNYCCLFLKQLDTTTS